MNKRTFLNIVAFLFLALMLFKVSAPHVYSHHDDDLGQIENCEICDSAIENQETEHLAFAEVTKESLAPITFEALPICSAPQTFTSSNAYTWPFCRPPPAMM